MYIAMIHRVECLGEKGQPRKEEFEQMTLGLMVENGFCKRWEVLF